MNAAEDREALATKADLAELRAAMQADLAKHRAATAAETENRLKQPPASSGLANLIKNVILWMVIALVLISIVNNCSP